MRYFENKLADYKAGSEVLIDKSKWIGCIESLVNTTFEKLPPSSDSCDGGLYVGNIGVAYMLYYLSKQESFKERKATFLEKAEAYVKVNLEYLSHHHCKDPPSAFILGPAGITATGCLLAQEEGNISRVDQFGEMYAAAAEKCMKIDFFKHGSDEMLIGRAGYLSGALALQQKLGKKVLNDTTLNQLCSVMIQSGQQHAAKHLSKSPLMYAYYGTEYLGAAHGLSGIFQMLMSFPDFFKSTPSAEPIVKSAVDYFLTLEDADGNYPPAMDEVGCPRPDGEELVHWCHGAPGVIYMYARAYKVWGDDKYLQACIRCGELVWKKGLLKKGPGICHGVAGSGYVFLLLFRLTNDKKYLHRALMFAEFMFTAEFKEQAKVPDSPYSLYEGWAGTICFLSDLMQPDKAEFPFSNVIF
ncbi:LanC-like protein 3 homolog,LanC-like protein 3 [Mytilus edulis]|uniref:LanC-like protein 3 homolog,LanC-like protein 3 n=1 Tax=Mytilus edulis TaxID=6550 RepID=A0A8S3R564_MYTED|nr:LanC-like protein 3 homolog,LanC-like protein 3 [Mytilus edulis]